MSEESDVLIAQHYEQVTEGAANLQAPANAVQAEGRGRGPTPVLAFSGNHQPRACCHTPATASLHQQKQVLPKLMSVHSCNTLS